LAPAFCSKQSVPSSEGAAEDLLRVSAIPGSYGSRQSYRFTPQSEESFAIQSRRARVRHKVRFFVTQKCVSKNPWHSGVRQSGNYRLIDGFSACPRKDMSLRETSRRDDQIHLPRRRLSGSHIGVAVQSSAQPWHSLVPLPRSSPKTGVISSVCGPLGRQESRWLERATPCRRIQSSIPGLCTPRRSSPPEPCYFHTRTRDVTDLKTRTKSKAFTTRKGYGS
jgi:hypothetical protein